MSAYNQFRIKFSRIPQKIPLPWADDPAARRLMLKNEWLTGDKGRLPRHYVAFYKEWAKGPQAYIHEQEVKKGRFEKDEFGNVQRIQNPRIPILYPEEFHKGLWGGEGVVKGGEQYPFKKHVHRFMPAKEMYWTPSLHLGVVYSEILDKHIEVVMTERAQRLIDEAFGLDAYLLKTPVNEIYSHFGLKLKRELLLTLANAEEELYPYESEKKAEIFDKYQDFVVPHEVADWHGLSLSEALHKIHTLDRIQEENSVMPLKGAYRAAVIEQLQNGDFDEEINLEEENVSFLSSAKNSFKSFMPK